jgi:hypothetical protein
MKTKRIDLILHIEVPEELEERECEQLLRASINLTARAAQMRMIFSCNNCGSQLVLPMTELIMLPDSEIEAPNLCADCGNYEDEPGETWRTAKHSEVRH